MDATDKTVPRAWLESGIEAGRLAGAVLMRWRSRFSIREKGINDLVTDADLESQRTIVEFLSGRFPGHAFLGEEGGGEEKDPGPSAPPTWIIDPVDGTSNYAHDFPFYCVSIGLQVAGELVLGVVYDPVRDEMFSASAGQGAFLNGRRIRVTPTEHLNRAMVTTGFPYDCKEKEFLFDWWRHFSVAARALRRTGSTALHLAYVACGRADMFYAFDSHAWDVAAGAVLVREAGGQVSNIAGTRTRFDPFQPDSFATNAPLHAPMGELFRKGPG